MSNCRYYEELLKKIAHYAEFMYRCQRDSNGDNQAFLNIHKMCQEIYGKVPNDPREQTK